MDLSSFELMNLIFANPKRTNMQKKRILFCSEATFLNTGYATYTREILNYLHSTGKYEIAEMASYGQRNDPRAANIPWKYYGVMPNRDCEPKASQEELQAYDSKGTNQFGEWIFEHVCLDFLPDVVCDIRDFWMLDFAERSPFRPYFKWCFPAGTPVVTDFGYAQPIESYMDRHLNGEKVATHQNRRRKVNKASSHVHKGLMVKIKAEGMAEPLVCTSDHEVLVTKKQKRTWNNETRRYHRKIDSIDTALKDFIPSSDLTIGDYLMLPIMELGHGIDCNDEDLWINGHFIADGSAREKYRISFYFHSDESDTIKRVEEYFKSENGDKKVDGNKTTLRFYGRHLVERFSKFYDQDGLKILPLCYKNLNKKQAKILLDGYFSGDGCVTRTNHNTPSIEMFSKSKTLARQVADIGRSLGYCFRLNGSRKQEGYSIRLSGHKCSDFSKELISKLSSNTESSKKDFTRVMIKDGYFLMPVTHIESYEDEVKVYDIEVEEDHSFITHCAVHNCVMPTVDARPQARQWVATYAGADACFTYSDWAGGVLTDQSGGKINYLGSAPPSAHPAYHPVEDKIAHKKKFGIDPKYKIIGTVMRNQRRKLYPDLFIAFKKFLDQAKSKDYYLYCHTSYPDLGWNIPELLQENELSSHVLFTYICNETNKPFPSLFKGAVAQSPFTGNWCATLSNVKNGASYEDLSSIVNLFDLYTQYANCEGFGLPYVEAAACGIPVCGTDYSAMESEIRKLEGYPLKPAALYKELETGCLRAVPDNDAAAGFFRSFFEDKKDEDRAKEGERTRKNFEKHFQWHLSGKQWEDYFDSFESLPIEQTWGAPPRIHQPEELPQDLPKDVPYGDLARWLIAKVLCEPEKLGTFFEMRLTKDLTYKTTTSMTGGMYFNESSAAFDNPNMHQPFSLQDAYNNLRGLCDRRNKWEETRINRMKQLKNA